MSSSSISPSTTSTLTFSSDSEDSLDYFPISLCELTERGFKANFANYAEIGVDDFAYHGPRDIGDIPSFNSTNINASIVMFGIGEDGSLFGWRPSTLLTKSGSKEIVIKALTNCFSLCHESIKKLKFNIYLVGGDGSPSSETLYNEMHAAILEFFSDAIIADQFINPTRLTGKDYITVNFNAEGELHYYFQ